MTGLYPARKDTVTTQLEGMGMIVLHWQGLRATWIFEKLSISLFWYYIAIFKKKNAYMKQPNN